MTEATNATPSISPLDVLPPQYRAVYEALKNAGFSITGSIHCSVKDEAGEKIPVFKYDNLDISNKGISVENLELNFAGIRRYSKIIDEITFAMMPQELREAYKAHTAECAAASTAA